MRARVRARVRRRRRGRAGRSRPRAARRVAWRAAARAPDRPSGRPSAQIPARRRPVLPAAAAAAAAVLGAERRWCSTLCLSPSRLRRLRWRRARRRQKGIARRRDHLARARVWGSDIVHVGGARARAAVPPHGRVRVRIRETVSTARTRTGELQAEQPAHDGGAEQDRGVITRRLLLLHVRLAESEGTPARLCMRAGVGGRGRDRST